MKSYVLLVCACLCAPALYAADWPGWRGPDRNDVSRETGLLPRWPANGPKLLWTYKEGGQGYSGPAVVGDRLYTLGSDPQKKTETVFALDVKTGERLWSTDFGPLFDNNWGNGPRGTPTVEKDHLYALGGQGELVCLETASGKKVWAVNLKKDLGGQMMSGWGYTESPLVDGDHLLCTPGGRQGTLACLDKKTGKVLWRSKDFTDAAAYCSIIVAEVDGVRQYIQQTGQGAAGVDAKTGQTLWYYERRGQTAVIPTVVYHDHHVYLTTGYGVGCDLIKLTRDGNKFKAQKVYANKNLVNHHGGVVLLGNHLYGYSDGRGWVCQDFLQGNNVWESKKLDKGSVTFAEGKLYCYSERDGTVALVEASPQGWKENGRLKIPQETKIRSPRGRIWTHPVVANGRLYLRDQDLIFCYDIKASTVAAVK